MRGDDEARRNVAMCPTIQAVEAWGSRLLTNSSIADNKTIKSVSMTGEAHETSSANPTRCGSLQEERLSVKPRRRD